MRKILLLILVAFSIVSCNRVTDRKVELKDGHDSISFAVSMLISERLPVKMEELGIDKETLPSFLRGIRDAFPVDGSDDALAYTQGLLVAASAMDMLERADEAVYPNDTTNKISRDLFLEGIIATAYGTGKTMTTKAAKDYYNNRIFRVASEDFMRKSKTRPGVVTLPSGLQYKIEKQGNGPVAGLYDKVQCIYKGSYPNGAVFDTSRGCIAELHVGRQVEGLAEALMTLPVGTECKLYIPWQLGYGAEGSEIVPPYSALVYDLEIKGIVGK